MASPTFRIRKSSAQFVKQRMSCAAKFLTIRMVFLRPPLHYAHRPLRSRRVTAVCGSKHSRERCPSTRRILSATPWHRQLRYGRSIARLGDIPIRAWPFACSTHHEFAGIDYSAGSYSVPERVRFRYKLRGIRSRLAGCWWPSGRDLYQPRSWRLSIPCDCIQQRRDMEYHGRGA